MRFGSRLLSHSDQEEEEGGQHMMDQPPTKNNRTFEQHSRTNPEYLSERPPVAVFLSTYRRFSKRASGKNSPHHRQFGWGGNPRKTPSGGVEFEAERSQKLGTRFNLG